MPMGTTMLSGGFQLHCFTVKQSLPSPMVPLPPLNHPFLPVKAPFF